MSNTDVELLSLTEVADEVGRPVRTVQWWAKEHRLPTVRVGTTYAVRADALPIARELAEHRGRRATSKNVA